MRPGGVVAVLMRNDLPFIEAVFAAGFAGGQTVPLNWHFTPEEIGYILADSGASHLVAHADLLAPLAGVIPDSVTVLSVTTPPEVCDAYAIDPRAAATPPGALDWDAWVASWPERESRAKATGGMMMYTSGTTGRPKGVRRLDSDPESRAANARLRQSWFGNRPGMRTAIIGPMYHSVQLSYTNASVSGRGEVELLPRFDAEQVLALIDEHRLTHLHLVPIMMSRLVKLPANVRDRYDVSSLEFVVHGSAPCPPEIKRALIAWFGPVLHEYYGTTECGMISRASSEEWLQRPGTVGRAWAGREIHIFDADGRPLPSGTEGEVYVSLGSMPDFTYHNDPAKRASIERAGCVSNGDIGYLDDDGYLFLCDRHSDVIISGGVNLYPAEIEAALAAHPEVVDAAVIGVPDDEYGERPLGLVTLAVGATATEPQLIAFARERLASFKVPRTIEMRDTLPRDEAGKVPRRRLREPYWGPAGRRI